MPETTIQGQEDKAFTGLISQQEAQYTALSTTPGQACANCRWFKAWGDYCHVVQDFPEPILATGHSNRWEAVPQIVVPEKEPIPVVIVEPAFDYGDSESMALSMPKSIVQRVKEFAAGLRAETPKLDEQPAFSVFKTANGRNGWIARHTGKWIDREGEILSEKSHDDYVERVQKGITPMPELWMWHAKGTKHGQAQAVWKSGGFVLAMGTFDGSLEGKRAFEYYQKHSGEIKLSHMFHYPRETKVNGVYHAYNTVEITTLPDGAEAFPYTSFEEIQTMALPKEAENMIAEALGQDALQRAREADNKALTDTKALDDLGVAWKGYDKYGDDIVPAEKIAGLEAAQKALDEAFKALGDLPATVTALNATVKTLQDELATSRSAENTALEKINALELKLAEYQELKPPASVSKDTLLNEREKSLVDSVVEGAKSSDQLSLVEKLLGSTPAVNSPS